MEIAINTLIEERNRLVDLLAVGDKAYIELYQASKEFGKPLNLGKLLREKHSIQEPLLKAIHELDKALMVLEPLTLPFRVEDAPLAEWERELLGL
jgi:hypothetical protein